MKYIDVPDIRGSSKDLLALAEELKTIGYRIVNTIRTEVVAIQLNMSRESGIIEGEDIDELYLCHSGTTLDKQEDFKILKVVTLTLPQDYQAIMNLMKRNLNKEEEIIYELY